MDYVTKSLSSCFLEIVETVIMATVIDALATLEASYVRRPAVFGLDCFGMGYVNNPFYREGNPCGCPCTKTET